MGTVISHSSAEGRVTTIRVTDNGEAAGAKASSLLALGYSQDASGYADAAAASATEASGYADDAAASAASVDRTALETVQGKSLILDENDDTFLAYTSEPDPTKSGADISLAESMLEGLGIPEMLDETWLFLADGQSRAGSTDAQNYDLTGVRRTRGIVKMPNHGLGVHGLSLVTQQITDGYGKPLAKYQPFSGRVFTEFVEAEERVNPKPTGIVQSVVVPMAETFALLRKTKIPQIVVSNVGQNGQSLVADGSHLGLHVEADLTTKTDLYNWKISIIQEAYDIALAEGKPLTKVAITFSWGEVVDTLDQSSCEDQINPYIDDTEDDIAAIDDTIEVVWIFDQAAGNTNRNDYPVRKAFTKIAGERDNVYMLGMMTYALTDAVHPTEQSKAGIHGTLAGYAVENIVNNRMWAMPTLSMTQDSNVLTLSSDVPLKEVYEFVIGESVKGFTLSGAATIETVELVNGFDIVITCDIAPSSSDVLSYCYRQAGGSETITGQPVGVGPFVLAKVACPSLIIPGMTAYAYVPGQQWTVI